MKIRVSYTYEIEGDDLLALNEYHKENMPRDLIRQLLVDIGKMGVEEQISMGAMRLNTPTEAL